MDMRTRTRRTTDSPKPDRKAAILLAAEKLFAQWGYHAVSIRQIAQEAQVPLALVGYYYGQKHELFQAIFAHWSGTIEERLAALKQIKLSPKSPTTLPAIIEAFIGPVLRMRASPEGEYYALLVARELSDAVEESDQVLRKYFDPLAHAFIDAIHHALPHASRGQAAWVYQFSLGALMQHITDSRIGRLSLGENTHNDPAAAAVLSAFIVGGIRAALTPKQIARVSARVAAKSSAQPVPKPSRRRLS
jgi:AcrR family transcriptional regulator